MEVMEREPQSIPGYMTVAEAAQLLGISKGATYQRLYRSKLPAVKAGRTLLLSYDVVLALYAAFKQYQRDE